MTDRYLRIRDQNICPMCLGHGKDVGLVVHWGRCYQGTGLMKGNPKAEAVLDAFERYLEALESLEVEECCV